MILHPQLSMTELLNSLIEALREELRQYGEMLARLDAQQDCITRRASDELLLTVGALQEQALILRQTRKAREESQRLLAEAVQAPANIGLRQLAESVSGPRRPLVHALVDENNQLLVRVQQRARQNHLLLRRSMDLMQDLIQTFCPSGYGTLYDPAGRSHKSSLPAAPLYDAAG